MSKHSRGFTLFEVLTAIAIFGIILLVAVPAFANHRRRLAITAAADSLRSIFRESRARAVDRSRNSGVKFTQTPAGWTYTIYDDGNGDGVTNDDITSGADPFVGGPYPLDFQLKPVTLSVGDKTIKDPDGDKLTSGDRPVQFGRSTICSFSALGSGTPGTIYLTDSASQLYAVRVLGATGRVRVMRYDGRTAKWVQL